MASVSTYWQLIDNDHTHAPYKCIDPTTAVVLSNLKAIDTAKIAVMAPLVTGTRFPVVVTGTHVTIQEVVDTDGVKTYYDILVGIVKKVTSPANQDETIPGILLRWDYNISELADELDQLRIDNGSKTYSVVFPGGVATSIHVDSILSNSTWTRNSALAATTETIRATGMTTLGALNKFISQLAAGTDKLIYHMWFNNTTKQVEFGTHRIDHTASIDFVKGMFWNHETYQSSISQVNGVRVYGTQADTPVHGDYPVPFTGDQLLMYQYDTATTAVECAQIATSIFQEHCSDPKTRVQFNTKRSLCQVGGVQLHVGDLIKCMGAPYIIMDITYSVGEVQIGLGYPTQGILDRYGDKLRLMTGTTSGQADQSWDPGSKYVSSDPAIVTEFTMTIVDTSAITSLDMVVTLASFDTSVSELQTNVANKLLSVADVPSWYTPSATSTIELHHAHSYYCPLDTNTGRTYIESDMFEDGIQHALATFSGDIVNYDVPDQEGVVYLTCLYQVGEVLTGTWIEAAHSSKLAVIPTTRVSPTSNMHSNVAAANTCYIPGLNRRCKVWVTWRLDITLPPSGQSLRYHLYSSSGYLNIVPKHDHTFQQASLPDPNVIKPPLKQDIGKLPVQYVPTIVEYRVGVKSNINSKLWDTIAVPPGLVSILDKVVADTNIIQFRRAAAMAASPFTVQPSAHYRGFSA